MKDGRITEFAVMRARSKTAEIGWLAPADVAASHSTASKGVRLPRLEVDDLTLHVPGRRLLTGGSFTVEAGSSVAVLGVSGSGKTSLLNCVAGISTPTSGSVRIESTTLSDLPPAARAEFRLRHIGIVFQFGELLPELSLLENVALPLRLLAVPQKEAEKRARGELERLGIGERAPSHPESLSGGEIQRAGVARALVHRPLVVLADEPTGMLDEDNTRLVSHLLVTAARELGVAVLMATHDPVASSVADHLLKIQDRRLVSISDLERSEPGR